MFTAPINRRPEMRQQDSKIASGDLAGQRDQGGANTPKA
jgi:hypothetical protein